MKRWTFPAGVFPEPVSVQGMTYFPYVQAGRGLVMRAWPDGLPDSAIVLWVDPHANTKGYVRNSVEEVDGVPAPLSMYYRDTPAEPTDPALPHVLVVRSDVTDADGNPVPAAPWRVVFNGNNPCCWGAGGRVGVQDASQFVLSSTWRNPPGVNSTSRPGDAMGLSRFDGHGWRLWSEDDPLTAELYGIRNPQWLPNGTIIGDGQNGGVGFVINGKVKWLDYGEWRNTPRGCLQDNGNYSVAWWGKDAREVGVCCDVAEADLWEMPIVAKFDRPKFVGVIFGSSEQYGYDPYAGNLETLFGAYNQWPASDYKQMAVPNRTVVISPGARNVPTDKNLGNWCDSLEGDLQAGGARRFRYSDGRVYADRVQHRDSDVRLFQCYPQKGESVEHFEADMNEQFNRFGGQKGIVPKFYEGNPPEDFTEAELEPFFPVFERLLRRPDCMGMLAFNGSRMKPDGTNAGIKKHPRWRMWLDALANAAGSALPAFVPTTPTPQPQPPAKKRFGGPVYEYLSIT